MFKMLVGFLCFMSIKVVIGCIPMKIMDPIMIPATDVCVSPPGTAFIFFTDDVELTVGPAPALGMKEAVGECKINFRDGAVKYYDGNTPANWGMVEGNEAIGYWDRTNCPNACVCTDFACYVPNGPDPIISPRIYFYPHCNNPSDCFVVAILYSDGSLVNPNNPSDMFDSASHEASPNVNGPAYPKIFKAGCSGCPVLKENA